MSYILEGLKKLEEKRKRAEPSRGIFLLADKIPEEKERKYWPYLLFLALMLNAALLAWWIIPRQSPEKTGTVLTTYGDPKSAVSSRPRQVSPQENKNPPLSDRKGTKAADSLSAAWVKKEEKKESKTVVLSEPPASPSEKTIDPQPKTVLPYRELPREIKNSLPPLKMSLHYFNPEKSGRFVVINNRNLQEGDRFDEGIKVKEINAEGVVLQFRDHLFLFKIGEGD